MVAPDINVILEMAKWTGEQTLTGGLPPEESRAYVRRSAKTVSGPRLPMAQVLEFEFPGPGGNLPARLYVPHGAPPPPRPMIVYFHGGGWMVGDLETNDSACRFLAAHSGVSILSPTYRLAPEHPFPAAVEDAQAAFRWAFTLAPELGADPARIAIGGDSAGGNMAAGVCIAMRDADGPRAAMQLLIYPATDAIEEAPSRRLFTRASSSPSRTSTSANAPTCPTNRSATSHWPRFCAPPTSPACRPPTWPRPASIPSATRARPTRGGCARPARGSRCAAIRG